MIRKGALSLCCIESENVVEGDDRRVAWVVLQGGGEYERRKGGELRWDGRIDDDEVEQGSFLFGAG